jgi:pimeloyl-ACP methyl ester carboxylesterase
MLLGLCVAGVITLAIVWRALTHPRRRTYAVAVARNQPGSPDELDVPRDYDEWTLAVRGVDLHAWSVRGDRPDGPVVVVTHGWGNSRIGGLARTPTLAREASWVVLWDQRGHGDTRGASTLGIHAQIDLLAIIEQVRATLPECDRHGLVLMGWSMGAGIALGTAAAMVRDPSFDCGPLRGVITESPYIDPKTPARAVISALGLPATWTLPIVLRGIALRYGMNPFTASGNNFGFDRLGEAEALGEVPLLVLHGDADTISPIEDGRAIAAATHHAELTEIAGAGHNDLWTDPAAFTLCDDRVRAFVRRAAGAYSAVYAARG